MFTKISLLNISDSPHLIPQIIAFLVRSLLAVCQEKKIHFEIFYQKLLVKMRCFLKVPTLHSVVCFEYKIQVSGATRVSVLRILNSQNPRKETESKHNANIYFV